MFNYIRSIIAGLLISIGVFTSPVQITPTPPPKISITITPKATSTVIPTPTIAVVQPQAKKCQFDKEGFIKKAKDYGYTAEEIDTFLTSLPPNYCPNDNANNSINSVVQSDQNNLQIIPTVSQENESSILNESKYEYEQSYRYSPPSPIPTIAIDVYGQDSINYSQYGNTLYGSDGSSYSKYGNTVYGNDGSSYSKYGNTMYGSDGSSYSQYGNTTYGNDGSSYAQYGNTTYGNDGSSCTKYGNSTYCN